MTQIPSTRRHRTLAAVGLTVAGTSGALSLALGLAPVAPLVVAGLSVLHVVAARQARACDARSTPAWPAAAITIHPGTVVAA